MSPDPHLPAWALDASLGIFIHWGPYSVPAWAEPTGTWGAVPEHEWFAHSAYAEWYANTIRIPGSPAAAHQHEAYGGREYGEFLDAWRGEQFDAREWARLFASAGADYVIPVTKHHDGVALWDAPHSDGRNTVDRGPKRDIIGQLAAAVRAEGMRFGVYYSGGLDWAYSDFPAIESMRDVEDYRPIDSGYARYATEQVRDLIEKYQPSVIWNDIEWPDAGKEDGTLDQLITFYRARVPDGIVNDRWGAEVGGYPTSEYAHHTHLEKGIGWEHNRGLGLSFGFNQLEDEALTLTARELARLYCDVVSRGGRLLINVGPKASGEIPDLQRNTLERFGQWVGKLKPLTINRSPVAAGEVRASGAGSADSWFRAWCSGGRTVVVTDGSTSAVRADGRDVTQVELPDE
ncbi:MAG: alpha-L-fucosidase [Leifsonia sp.]